MNVALLFFLTLASFATAQVDRGCRVCQTGTVLGVGGTVLGVAGTVLGQAGCQTIPREDGGCPSCICNGVVKSDCPIVRFCPPTCRRELDGEGCSSCECGEKRCQALAACAAGCSQTTGADGCLRCDCTVRTNNNNVCPAVQSCIKGCIQIATGDSCFSCTCNSPNVNGFGGNGAGGFGVNGVNGFGVNGVNGFGVNGVNGFGVNGVNGFGVNGVNGFGVNGVNGFGVNGVNGFVPGVGGVGPIGLDGNRCPAGCRLGIATLTGTSQCYCGNNAAICPAVPLCFGRCLFKSAEGCCRCNCPEATAASVASGRVPLATAPIIPGAFQGRVPGAFQGRVPGAFQGRVPGAFQGRFPGAFQGRVPGAFQGRVPGAFQGRVPGRFPGQFRPTSRFPGSFGFQGIPRSPGSFRGQFGPVRQVSESPLNPLPTSTPLAVTPAPPAVEPLSPGSGTGVGGQVPDL